MNQPQFTIQTENLPANTTKFVFEPLPQGYGHTLGNALRRVLYTSIPGAAITSVTITGASHQFTAIEGVKEDAVQIILNLKSLHLSLTGDKAAKITLSAKGAGVVTAEQFELPGNVKIANPEAVIGTITDKSGHLEIEATVEPGMGYSPAEERKSSTIGVIPVDATFTPVLRVNYEVMATRVGRVTNFDKLILDVTTDGTTTPEEAVKQAAQILVDYFAAVVSPNAESTSTAKTSTSTTSSAPAASSKPGGNVAVEELDLPTRIANALQKAGFNTVADLLAVPKNELAKVKNLGGKSVKVVEVALADRGFQLS